MQPHERDRLMTCAEINAAEQAVFEVGASAENLMEAVGERMATIIQRNFPSPGTVIAFVGAGHNGGDALVVARILGEMNWEVFVRPAVEVDEFRPLTAQKLEEVGELGTEWDAESGLRPEDPRPVVLLDGLLGIGAKGPLRPGYREAAAEMNALRLAEHATTFALDIPSGVDGDLGEVHEDAVVADFTLTIGYAKPGLVVDGALNNVGRISIVAFPEIEALPGQGDDTRSLITASMVGRMLPRRTYSSHKGTAGRVAIIAGSRGLTGAASLCAMGALRAGGGLVTVFVHKDVYPIVAAAAPHEAMVTPYHLPQEIDLERFDVLAVGPGMGFSPEARAMLEFALHFKGPMVIDADGLNLLACGGLDPLVNPPGPRLLTPHPGEMARLKGGILHESGGISREEVARGFVAEHPAVTLLYKGSRTLIAETGKPLRINSTGHPAMATGGIGDVLTGLSAALIAQGLSLFDAACAGSWLMGRAAEFAVYPGSSSPESLTAGDVASHLGFAFEAAKSEQG